MAPNVVNFIWDEKLNAYSLSFPYNKAFVEILKKCVSANERDYDPPTKTWYIAEKYYDAILVLLQQIFERNGTKIFTFPRAKHEEFNQGVRNEQQASPTAFLEVIKRYAAEADIYKESLETLSLADATKIYRKLALAYHPDRNPSNAPIMSSINEAWANLKGVYFK